MTLLRNEGNQEALKKRANNLEINGFNGIKQVIVNVPSGQNSDEAYIDVHFYNENTIQDILNDSKSPNLLFPIYGGRKIQAGPGIGQAKVTKIANTDANNVLKLTITPVGDYSTYILSVNYIKIDPIFSEIEFKFRPGCFTTECAPDGEFGIPPPPPQQEPTIDYLAKDFDSFRHTMIVAMMDRVPGWQPTSEADLDQVLLELFSASGDELSDFQDRVMSEAFLATARKRVSLARYARLMDYHIHQGNQASTWIAIILAPGVIDFSLLKQSDWENRFKVWTKRDQHLSSPSTVFVARDEERYFHHLLNQMELYTWSDSMTKLRAGTTTADLKFSSQQSADTVQNLIRDGTKRGTITHLLIQERLNPKTAREAGRDQYKRQLLKLLQEDELTHQHGATAIQDPITQEWFVRVHWEEKDQLRSDYFFTVQSEQGKDSVSYFYGNLVQVCYGLPMMTIFKEQGKLLEKENEYYFDRRRWGTLCRLPEGPLLYEDTPEGGEIPPKSTLQIEVKSSSGSSMWQEVISLIHSDEDDEHFVVETDEDGWASIRFGIEDNGKNLPEGSIVKCYYQIGKGDEGNIGADSLVNFDKSLFVRIESCWNPFDITNGKDQETREKIIRRAVEGYKFKQQRAVTLQDYADIVERIEEVSKASAMYMWTGSWRTVRIAVDPAGTTNLTQDLKNKVVLSLEAAKLIGEDFEIRAAQYVPIEIHVKLCINENYWINDIKYILKQEFSNGYTHSRKKAFFHPDNWTFGQELRASQIIGRVQSIEGVDNIMSIEMKRWNEKTSVNSEVITIQSTEIIQVENNPDHMEKGFIDFIVEGGRQ